MDEEFKFKRTNFAGTSVRPEHLEKLVKEVRAGETVTNSLETLLEIELGL